MGYGIKLFRGDGSLLLDSTTQTGLVLIDVWRAGISSSPSKSYPEWSGYVLFASGSGTGYYSGHEVTVSGLTVNTAWREVGGSFNQKHPTDIFVFAR